jgi:integrase
MASIHKLPGKPNWICFFRDSTGKQHCLSCRTRDRRIALKVAAALGKASDLAGQENLSVDRARQLIEDVAVDILETARGGTSSAILKAVFEKAAEVAGQGGLTRERVHELVGKPVGQVVALAGETLPADSIGAWCDRWLQIKEVESEPTTHTRYELGIRAFKDFLGAKVNKRLDTLRADTVLDFRDKSAKKLAVGSVNTHLRILRACLNAARRQGFLSVNPATQVAALKERGESKRRALTLIEIQNVLSVCGDTPWRGLVLLGLYTGQRLGDCGRLRWQQVDLPQKEIWFVTEKTGKRLAMRLAEPLADCLSSLPSVDDPSAPVFPRFAQMAAGGISSLSNAFACEVLIPAKLMPPRPPKHKATGKGRTGKRVVNPVSFHSLRHSFVTMLKATGASNALAEMIVGHDSPAISRRYTHLSAADTAAPISKLPDVTAKQAAPAQPNP